MNKKYIIDSNMLHKKNMFIQKQKNNCIESNTKSNLKSKKIFKKKRPFKILLIINNVFKIILNFFGINIKI